MKGVYTMAMYSIDDLIMNEEYIIKVKLKKTNVCDICENEVPLICYFDIFHFLSF
jgi:hypothetical protein